MQKLITNCYTEIWLDNNIHLSIFQPNLTVTLEIAKALVTLRMEVSNGKSGLWLFDVSNIIAADLEAIKYLSSDEALINITAGAIYTSAPIGKFAGKLFIDINQQRAPAKLFNDLSEAKLWLQQYK